MTAIQNATLKLGFGLSAPDGSATFGWEYLPTPEDQLRYLVEHKTTKEFTVYEPIALLFKEEEGSWSPIHYWHLDWADIVAKAPHIVRITTQAPPRADQLVLRPIHDLMGLSAGLCTDMFCKNILDGVEDTDIAVCNGCWDSL